LKEKSRQRLLEIPNLDNSYLVSNFKEIKIGS